MLPTLDETRECWDRAFARADHLGLRSEGRDLSEAVRFLRSHSIVTVLDVGCGLGHWSLALARAGFRVTALDVSAKALALVQERGRAEGLIIPGLVSPAQEMRDLGDPFDAVVCSSVLDHMAPPDAASAIERMRMATRPGGLLYLSFDGPDEIAAGKDPEIVRRPDGTRQCVSGERRGMLWRFYSNEEIRALCLKMKEVAFHEGPQGRREIWLAIPPAAP